MENVVFHLDSGIFCSEPQLFSKKFVDVTLTAISFHFCVYRGEKSKKWSFNRHVRHPGIDIYGETRKNAVSRNYNVLHNWSRHCAPTETKDFLKFHKSTQKINWKR